MDIRGNIFALAIVFLKFQGKRDIIIVILQQGRENSEALWSNGR